MSMSSASAPASAKTDLETVIHWPLLVTAAGGGFLLLAVPVVLACIAAMKGDAAKDKVAVRTPPRTVERANVVAVETPARQVAHYVPPPDAATSRPVYVEPSRPPLKPVPVRKVATVAVTPRPLDPVLHFPDVESPPVFTMKRLDTMAEEYQLRRLVEQAKEVDLESVKGTREKLLAKAREAKSDKESSPAILALHTERADLKGLPMRGAADCRADAEAAKIKGEISQELRGWADVSFNSLSRATSIPHFTDLHHLLSGRKKWLEEAGVTTLIQMLQVKGFDSRREFIKSLATVKESWASRVLARQGLFDFSADIREEAIKALKERPREECRQVFLEGLRYPWAPVAAHAAEALVALDDRETIFTLAGLLDQPDPCAPVRDKNNNWVVSEMVRVNHLRNCLLCHAPSTELTDPLRGAVPTPGRPLPHAYYATRKGDFVRADVTYLRQDFSLIEPVVNRESWPAWQRFDYMVRTRELTADERAALDKKPRKPKPASYPQREAVLFALRELTGLDAGDQSADWYELLWVTATLP